MHVILYNYALFSLLILQTRALPTTTIGGNPTPSPITIEWTPSDSKPWGSSLDSLGYPILLTSQSFQPNPFTTGYITYTPDPTTTNPAPTATI